MTHIRVVVVALVSLWGTAAWADGTFDMCKVYKTHCKRDTHCETVGGAPRCVPDKKPVHCKPACKAGEKCEAVQCIKAPCPNQCVKK